MLSRNIDMLRLKIRILLLEFLSLLEKIDKVKRSLVNRSLWGRRTEKIQCMCVSVHFWEILLCILWCRQEALD